MTQQQLVLSTRLLASPDFHATTYFDRSSECEIGVWLSVALDPQPNFMRIYIPFTTSGELSLQNRIGQLHFVFAIEKKLSLDERRSLVSRRSLWNQISRIRTCLGEFDA